MLSQHEARFAAKLSTLTFITDCGYFECLTCVSCCPRKSCCCISSCCRCCSVSCSSCCWCEVAAWEVAGLLPVWPGTKPRPSGLWLWEPTPVLPAPTWEPAGLWPCDPAGKWFCAGLWLWPGLREVFLLKLPSYKTYRVITNISNLFLMACHNR